MHNDEDYGPYGNIGFNIPGIQIYLPLTPNLILGFWHGNIEKKIQAAWEESAQLHSKICIHYAMNPNANKAELRKAIDLGEADARKREKFIECVTTGTPIVIEKTTIDFFNSLQVTWSHRFVLKKEREFQLVKRMINDNEDYREGMKIRID